MIIFDLEIDLWRVPETTGHNYTTDEIIDYLHTERCLIDRKELIDLLWSIINKTNHLDDIKSSWNYMKPCFQLTDVTENKITFTLKESQ